MATKNYTAPCSDFEIQGKPFQKIPEASRNLGLSQYLIRKMCREGTMPCIKSGSAYIVNVQQFLKQQEEAAGRNA